MIWLIKNSLQELVIYFNQCSKKSRILYFWAFLAYKIEKVDLNNCLPDDAQIRNVNFYDGKNLEVLEKSDKNRIM